MKKILFFLTILALTTGCAQKNAFAQFQLSPVEELSEDSIQSSKLKNKQEIDGVVNVIYLNSVLSKEYKDAEYFYVYLYRKTKKNPLNFWLNKKRAINIEKLPAKNRFASLTSFDAPWSSYYLVKFTKTGDILNFRVKEGKYSSDIFQYEKDQ